MLDLRLEYEYTKEDIDAAIKRCLEHQKWIFGPEIKEFEDKVEEYLGVKHCVGVSSGTEALVLSLRALAIKIKGQEYFDGTDEIITTPFTFTATGDAILRSGASPVFVDIDPVSYNIDPGKIKFYLTTQQSDHSTKVVGIIPVHLYGQSSQMDEIMALAKEYDLFVLEDAAQAFGGMWKGRKLGSIGTAGTFSFFPTKNLGGFGDAGMISTDDDGIAELARMLLKHGGKDKYNVDHIGYNGRLDTFHAAILLAKFKYIDEFNDRRRKIAEIFTRGLSDIDDLILPVTNVLTRPLSHSTTKLPDGHVYHQYTIRVSNGKRDELQNYLKEKGISTMVYYPFPLHKMKVFEGRMKIVGDLNKARNAVDEVLSLPIGPFMKKEDITKVVQEIRGFYRN